MPNIAIPAWLTRVTRFRRQYPRILQTDYWTGSRAESLWQSLFDPRHTSRAAAGGFRNRLWLEPLEDRRMLATYTWHHAPDTLAIHLDTNESLTVTQASGAVTFTLSSGTFTKDGGDTSIGDGTSALVVANSDLAGALEIDNNLATSGTNDVTFSGSGALTSDFTVSLVDPDAVSSISFVSGFDISAVASRGINLEATRNISVGSGTSITSVSGGISLIANQHTPTSGSFAGISVINATIESTSGAITLIGRGGDSGSSQYGVQIDNSSTVGGSTTGNVFVEGVGGRSADSNNIGVSIGVNSQLTSGARSVSVIGIGGGIDASTNNHGLHVQGLISAGGTGSTSIDVSGGNHNGTGGNNHGVWVVGPGVITTGGGQVGVFATAGGGQGSTGVTVSSGGEITSGGGKVTVQGFGGIAPFAFGATNYGVRVSNAGSRITSGGGNVKVTGTGGGTTFNNHGVSVANSAQITAGGSGTVTVEGTAGAGGNGIDVASGGAIVGAGAANVTLIADTISVQPGGTPATVDAANGTVTVRTMSTNRTIDLGGGDSGSQLGLSDAELDRIIADTLVIGAATAGTITISDDVSRSASTDIELRSGVDILFNPGSIDTAGGNLLLAPGLDGVLPISSGADVTANHVSLNTALRIAINGDLVDTQYSQLNVAGQLDLHGASLSLTGGEAASVGEVFTIVTAANITNTFNGLNEGDTLLFNNRLLRVNYTPTAVTLTTLNLPPSPVATSYLALVDQPTNITLQASDPEGTVNAYTVTQQPLNGVLTGSAPNLVYTPNPGFVGTDTFYFKSTDNLGAESFEAEVTIDVLPQQAVITLSTTSQTVSEGVGVVTVSVTSDIVPVVDIIIPVSLTGSAVQDRDYAQFGGVLIPAGSTTGTAVFTIDDDSRYESLPETIVVALQPIPQATFNGPTIHTITINDNDTVPSVSFGSISQVGAEGETVTISVIISGESDSDVVVPLVYLGNADASDYSGPTSITIPAGQRTASATVSIADDLIGESTELISIDLGSPSGATVATEIGFPVAQFITIPQNDAPTISFNSSYRAVAESAGVITIVVQKSNPTLDTIEIPFSVVGTADGLDRTVLTPSPLVFAPNDLTATIDIRIENDGINEPGIDEVVVLQLLDPSSGSAILGTTQTYTVAIDDDDIPQAQITAVSNTTPWENEGSVTYTVSLSLPSTATVTVPITVSGSGSVPSGYATRGASADFNTSTAAIVFNPGETSVVRTVTINNDSTNESSEKIEISLQAPTTSDAVLGKTTKKTITIKDNDPLVTVAASKTSVAENAANFNFVVSLSAPTNVAVTVPLVWSGTAGRGKDYSVVDPNEVSSAVIAAGSTSRNIGIDIIDDSIDEANQIIEVKLKDPAGEAKLGTAASDSVTITDNDSAPTIAWVSRSFSKNESNTSFKLSLELSKASERDVTLSFVVLGGTNTWRDTDNSSQKDFGVNLSSSGKVKIPAGSRTATLTVTLYDDSRVEGYEIVDFYLTGATNATLPAEAQRKIRMTIVDNDSMPASVPSSNNVATGPFTVALPTPGVYEAAPGSSIKSLGTGYSGPTVVTSKSININSMSPAGTLSGLSTQGLYDGAVVFFDANFNGVLDFLDLNGNGIQDEEDPAEPSVVTALDGSFLLPLLTEFDVNADGLLTHDEGRLVMFGGVDTSIGLTSVTRLTAPLTQPVVTPLSTIVEALMRIHAFSIQDANQRVAEAFGLTDAGFATTNPVHGSTNDNGLATETERASVKISNAVVQIAQLFSGVSIAPPLDFLADAVFAEIAQRISAMGSELDLSVLPVIVDLINGVSLRTGVQLDPIAAQHAAIADGAAQVIADGNIRIDAIDNTGDVDFLKKTFAVKKTKQVDAAAMLKSVTAGTESIANVVCEFTGASSAARIDNVTIGQLIPPALFINHSTIIEGSSGQQFLELTVSLIGDHSLPVSVEYFSNSDTASIAGNDYFDVAGTLNWIAGDNTGRTISIPVHGDTQFEPDENFRVFLANATNAVIREGIGFGFILNDEVLDTTPAATAANNLHTLQVNDFSFAVWQNGVITAGGQHAAPLHGTIRGTDNVDDTFVLDLSENQYRPDVLTFIGGGGTGFDTVEVYGGNFQTITQRLNNATDGQTVFAAEDQPAVTLNWQGMEPVLVNVGSVAEMIFELPAGVTDAVLEDADPTDTNPELAGKLRLYSPSLHFEETIFTIPEKITIRVGNGHDQIEIGNLDPAFVGIIQIDATLGAGAYTVIYDSWTIEANETVGDKIYDVFSKGTSPDIVFLKVEVPPVNDSPIATSTILTMPEDMSVDIDLHTLANDTETPDASLIFSAGNPVNGSVQLISGHIARFMPNANYHGSASFTYTVTDTGDGSAAPITTAPVQISVNVTPVVDPGSLFVSSPTVSESDGTITFLVSLDGTVDGPFTVNFATVADSAQSPGDYTHKSGQLSFAGTHLESKTATVSITPDSLFELTESFKLVLSNVQGTIEAVTVSTAHGTGSITDDDTAPTVTLGASPATISENGGVSTVTATLSQASGLPTTINLGFTGTAGSSDYNASANSITIPAGQTAGTITITGASDSLSEGSETVVVDITSLTNATEAGQQQATVTLTNHSTIGTNLQVTSSMPTSVVPGSGSGNLTYKVTVKNAGNLNVTNVVLEQSGMLPPGVSVKSIKTSSGSKFIGSPTNGTWTIVSLQKGKSATLEITLTVGSSAVPAANAISLTTSAISAAPGLINTGDDTTTRTASIVSQADLSVTKSAPKEVIAGASYLYTVTVKNSGKSAAQDVVLNDILPSYVTIVSQVQKSGSHSFTLSNTAHSISNSIASLPNGASATFEILVSVPASVAENTKSTSTATVSATSLDPKTSNNKASTVTKVEHSRATLAPSDTDPGKYDLVIGGSSKNDTIEVTRSGSSVKVTVNGKSQGTFKPTGKIVAYGRNGNDRISIDKDITLPSILVGGEGHDQLNGGGGPTILSGEAGTDKLVAGAGRSVLIGGTGSDTLVGGKADDVLIGGRTNIDNNQAALLAVLNTWNSGNTYPDRVTAVDAFLDTLDDSQEDELTGNLGRDLFFNGLGDDLQDVVLVGGDAETVA